MTTTDRRALFAVAFFAAALLVTGCGGAPPPVQAADDAEDEPTPPYVLAIRFEDAGFQGAGVEEAGVEEAGVEEAGVEGGSEEVTAVPQTRVRLVAITPDGDRRVYDLGVEPGPCYLEPVADALLGARCWWPGQGARYRVERRGEHVVGSRAEEDADERPGPFEERGRVEIPAGARIDLLGSTAAVGS